MTESNQKGAQDQDHSKDPLVGAYDEMLKRTREGIAETQ